MVEKSLVCSLVWLKHSSEGPLDGTNTPRNKASRPEKKKDSYFRPLMHVFCFFSVKFR